MVRPCGDVAGGVGVVVRLDGELRALVGCGGLGSVWHRIWGIGGA
jgi:hypothetical protein